MHVLLVTYWCVEANVSMSIPLENTLLVHISLLSIIQSNLQLVDLMLRNSAALHKRLGRMLTATTYVSII